MLKHRPADDRNILKRWAVTPRLSRTPRKPQLLPVLLALLGMALLMTPTVTRADSASSEPFADALSKAAQYLPTAQEQAKLLEQVRQADADRAKAKAKSPGVIIVNRGQATATIVIAPPPPPAPVDPNSKQRPKALVSPDLAAGKTLQQWVKLMSGVTLPISEKPAAHGVNIYVGTAAAKAGLDLSKIKSETHEGIRIKADGKNVYIGSQKGAGVAIRAVGRFLETEFGCRYFSTEDWGRVYPHNQKTLSVMTQDFSEAPKIDYRRIWGAEGAFGNPVWRAWSGDGGDSIPTGHSWGGILPKEAFKTHPEYFRMNAEGQRVNGSWYNLGNSAFRKLFIKWAVNISDHGQKDISLSMPDSYQEDFSPDAKKYDDPNALDDTTGRVSMTNRFVGLVNEAAKAIAATGGPGRVGFYAYSDYTLPPTLPSLDHLSPNLLINIAPIRYTRFHPIGYKGSQSAVDLKNVVEGWASHASMLGYRTYNYNLAEELTPFAKLAVWAHDMPYLYKHGFIAFNLESMDSWELSGPHLYQSIRLAYDPTLDPWVMMADYWDKFYGPAAVPMQAYWLDLSATWATLETQAGSIHGLPNVFTPARLKKLDEILTKAEKQVKDQPDYAYRVHLARRGWVRAEFWRHWFDQINQGDIDGAQATYDKWFAYTAETVKANNGNPYETRYLARFINSLMTSAYDAIHPHEPRPKQAKHKGKKKAEPLAPLKMLPPRQVVAVLPDVWKYRTQADLDKAGVKTEPIAANLNDNDWEQVKTYSNTLNGQGHEEYFGVMWYRTTWKAPANAKGPFWLHFVKADRKITVFINGKKVSDDEIEGFRGATISVDDALKPGQVNQITVRINHIPLPELYLGGIVAPVYILDLTQKK